MTKLSEKILSKMKVDAPSFAEFLQRSDQAEEIYFKIGAALSGDTTNDKIIIIKASREDFSILEFILAAGLQDRFLSVDLENISKFSCSNEREKACAGKTTFFFKNAHGNLFLEPIFKWFDKPGHHIFVGLRPF